MTAFQSKSVKGFEGERKALLFTLVFVSVSLSLKIPFSTLATFCDLFIPLIPKNSSKKREIMEGLKFCVKECTERCLIC